MILMYGNIYKNIIKDKFSKILNFNLIIILLINQILKFIRNIFVLALKI